MAAATDRFRIEPANQRDAEYVAFNMRKADVLELSALSGLKPHDAVQAAISLTRHPYIAYDGARPVAVFGITGAVLGDVGSPWLLATNRATKCSRYLITMTPAFLKMAFRSYRRLENVVHAENREAIRFLRWAGFTLEPAHTTQSGAKAHEFWMEKPS